jgi:hypothetical protein
MLMFAWTMLLPSEKLSCTYVVGTTPVCEKVSMSSGTPGGVCSVVPDWSGCGLERLPMPMASDQQAVEIEPPFALAERALAVGRGGAARQRRDLRRRRIQRERRIVRVERRDRLGWLCTLGMRRATTARAQRDQCAEKCLF